MRFLILVIRGWNWEFCKQYSAHEGAQCDSRMTHWNSGRPDLAQREAAWLVGPRSAYSSLVLVEALVHAPCQQTARPADRRWCISLRCAFDRPVARGSLSFPPSIPLPLSPLANHFSTPFYSFYSFFFTQT